MTETILKAILTTVIPSVLTGMCVFIKTRQGKVKALENGMLSLLRAEIIRQHDKYTDRGNCPIYAKDALEKAYNAYHALGGNGTITKIYKETMALPNDIKEKKA